MSGISALNRSDWGWSVILHPRCTLGFRGTPLTDRVVRAARWTIDYSRPL
jgi:hypothetical protein